MEEDPSIPKEYESLNVVKDFGNAFLMSKDHILDQEMYDKLAFYADTFDGVDFKALMEFEWESYHRHAGWKGEWRIQRFMEYMYPQFSAEEHQEKQRGVN